MYSLNYRLEFFNATEWVNLFERSGARYAVLTSKHHEVYKGIDYTWLISERSIGAFECAVCDSFIGVHNVDVQTLLLLELCGRRT